MLTTDSNEFPFRKKEAFFINISFVQATLNLAW